MEKRGQLSIFIILGILFVAGLASYFAFKGNLIPSLISGKDVNPNIFLEACLKEKIKDTAEIISLHGGSVNPSFSKKFKFNNDNNYHNIAYLCYNENYYVPCINQQPMLIQHIKKEFKDEIKETVEDCYQDMLENLEEEDYEAESNYRDFEIKLIPEEIKIEIDANVSLKKNDVFSERKGFVVSVKSHLYDMAVIAQEIVSQEAEYCSFNNLGFMMLNPEFEVSNLRTSDLETIYTIKYKDSGEEFRFVVHSCVNPPGN